MADEIKKLSLKCRYLCLYYSVSIIRTIYELICILIVKQLQESCFWKALVRIVVVSRDIAVFFYHLTTLFYKYNGFVIRFLELSSNSSIYKMSATSKLCCWDILLIKMSNDIMILVMQIYSFSNYLSTPATTYNISLQTIACKVWPSTQLFHSLWKCFAFITGSIFFF